MNWLESIFYGLITGLAEFLPVPARAHQLIFTRLTGAESASPLCELMVHLGLLFAVCISAGSLLKSLRSDPRRVQSRKPQASAAMRLFKTASVPMAVLLCFYPFFWKTGESLPVLAVLLLVNGIILFVPNLMLRGNKDARSMSALDSLLIGAAGGLSVFPGMSRIGCALSVAAVRGADKQHAFNWALLLSIPALAIFCFFDFLSIFSREISSNFFCCLISGVSAFLGGYFSIKLMRTGLSRLNYNGFAYYSWGAALFTFILYLTV